MKEADEEEAVRRLKSEKTTKATENQDEAMIQEDMGEARDRIREDDDNRD